MKLFSISCKKATYLVSKKEENRLSWIEKIQLSTHLTICSLCKKFEEQTGFIIRHAHELHSHNAPLLSDTAKRKMQELLLDQ